MEEAAFAAFFRDLYPVLCRYARRSVDAATAEEVAADALDKIWERNEADPADDVEWRRLASFAFRIVEGLVRTRLRGDGRHRRLLFKIAKFERPDAFLDPPTGDQPRWFRELPDVERRLLQLVADGFAISEIAALMELEPATVSRRMYRARQHAKEMIAKEVSDGLR